MAVEGARSAAESSPRPARSVVIAEPRKACCMTGRCGTSRRGERRGPHERHVATVRRATGRRMLVVGGEDEAIEYARFSRGVDRVGDERFAPEQPGVLAGEPLRPASGGDDAEDLQRRPSPARGRPSVRADPAESRASRRVRSPRRAAAPECRCPDASPRRRRPRSSRRGNVPDRHDAVVAPCRARPARPAESVFVAPRDRSIARMPFTSALSSAGSIEPC